MHTHDYRKYSIDSAIWFRSYCIDQEFVIGRSEERWFGIVRFAENTTQH